MGTQYAEIIRVAQELFVIGETYPRHEIISRVCDATGIDKDSFYPTDYCYNLTNNGIAKEKHRPLFEQIKRGHGATFKYLGLDADYKEEIQHFSRS